MGDAASEPSRDVPTLHAPRASCRASFARVRASGRARPPLGDAMAVSSESRLRRGRSRFARRDLHEPAVRAPRTRRGGRRGAERRRSRPERRAARAAPRRVSRSARDQLDREAEAGAVRVDERGERANLFARWRTPFRQPAKRRREACRSRPKKMARKTNQKAARWIRGIDEGVAWPGGATRLVGGATSGTRARARVAARGAAVCARAGNLGAKPFPERRLTPQRADRAPASVRHGFALAAVFLLHVVLTHCRARHGKPRGVPRGRLGFDPPPPPAGVGRVAESGKKPSRARNRRRARRARARRNVCSFVRRLVVAKQASDDDDDGERRLRDLGGYTTYEPSRCT